MASDNFAELEKKAGRKAAQKLRKSLKDLIKHGFETTQGNSDLLRSTVLSKMKAGQLERLVIKMPHYGFKNHFGFEGVRSNSIRLKLISRKGFLADAVTKTNALEKLATEIGEIRADEVSAEIKF
jgi:hypothetical protein